MPLYRLFAATALAMSTMITAGTAKASCTLPPEAQSYVNEMADALNAQRRSNGLSPLRHDRRLSQAAAIHACDMQVRGFFDHRGSDGTRAHDRVIRAGFRSCQTSENIAYGYPTANSVVTGWMNSPGHRRNMLSTGVEEFGIGVAEAPGGPYAVLVFGRTC